MKDLLAKLKNLDYKQVAIDHGEKAGVAIIGLFVLIALAGTSWSRYERTPQEFLDKVAQGEANLAASQWPDEERQKLLAAPDVIQLLEQVDAQKDLSVFEYRTPFFWPLYSKREKYKEPEWLPVRELIADAGYAILEFQKESAEEEGEEVAAGTETEAEGAETETGTTVAQATTGPQFGPTVDELAPRKTGPASRTLPSSRTIPGAIAPPGVGMGLDEEEAEYGMGMEEEMEEEEPEEEEEDYGAEAMEEDEYYGGMEEEEAGYYGTTSPLAMRNTEARGLRYVAVRGVFPYKEQLEKLADALNIPVAADAEPYLDFFDFELQRQKAVPGPDPWAGPWERVDIQDAFDVLNKVVGYDVDPVDAVMQDAVFTMPLPYRVAGEWGDRATHPRIATLSKDQAEQQAVLNQKLTEIYQQLMRRKQEPFRKRGFAVGQLDVRTVRTELAASGTDMRKVIETIKQELASGKVEGLPPGVDPQKLLQDIDKMQLTAIGQYLLFRYLDFDVEPGNAYRYRVRLVVRNPNYQRPIAELVDPASAEGFTRTTPWSEPSNVVVVPQDEQVFVSAASVSRDGSDVNCTFEVFKWYEDSGTTIRAVLDKLHAGDQVGGKVTTEVLRPAENTFQDEEIEVETKNYLVDIAPRALALPGFDPRQHRDLELEARAKISLPVADEALIMKPSGRLVVIDSVSSRPLRQQALARLKAQNEPWQDLKKEKPKSSTLASKRGRRGRGRGLYEEEEMDEYYDEGMEEDMSEYGEEGEEAPVATRRRGRSFGPIRRGRFPSRRRR